MMTKFKTEETGFFVMEDAHKVLSLNLQLAKLHCLNKVDVFVNLHPQTHQGNIDKARNMINRARSNIDLSMGISNFMLSHTSENLSVI
jgi:hypothetical protein